MSLRGLRYLCRIHPQSRFEINILTMLSFRPVSRRIRIRSRKRHGAAVCKRVAFLPPSLLHIHECLRIVISNGTAERLQLVLLEFKLKQYKLQALGGAITDDNPETFVDMEQARRKKSDPLANGGAMPFPTSYANPARDWSKAEHSENIDLESALRMDSTQIAEASK